MQSPKKQKENDMKVFPEGIKFKYPWRNYQQRVLDDLEEHLSDRHLHVVAPPGSGKTVLGLETAIRLNKPALILAPTLTIRNQWIQRLCELFLDTRTVPDWISTNIRKPAFLTVVTYQGLHAACGGVDEKAQIQESVDDELEYEYSDNESDVPINANLSMIIKELKSKKVGTIVLDEAHHLKREWWNTLIKVKEALDPFVVALTATPPYDVSYTEWKRYLEVNGTIDTEISVPELVREEDLCPHQDFAYFSQPTAEEFRKINDFRKDVDSFFNELKHSEILLKVLPMIPAWVDPQNNLEWIYDNLKIYTSILIFFRTNEIDISDIHLNIIGIDTPETEKKKNKKPEIIFPELNYKRMEVLLQFFLFGGGDFFIDYESEQEELKHQLRRHGVLEQQRIGLLYNDRINKMLISSDGKMKSINEIVSFEYKNLGNQLRMVILSDYIRKEYLDPENKKEQGFDKIGVVPIFELLRKANNEGNMKLGMLTGSLVIIPLPAFRHLEILLFEMGVESRDIIGESYAGDYIMIKPIEKLKNKLVSVVTRLFESGEINILVGTKSLLGEGWDAPAINSLVLASFVGSFVLSNQMRGRAIRTQKGNPAKTSNIWHLVCIDPTIKDGGADVELMKRRFKSFVGITNGDNPVIESGWSRLGCERETYNAAIVKELNQETFENAAKRDTLYIRWQRAIGSGIKLVEEIKIPFRKETDGLDYKRQLSLYWNKTIKYLIADLVLALMAFGAETILSIFRNLRMVKSVKWLVYFIVTTCVIGLLSLGKKTYKTLKLYIKYRDISKDIQQIGNALLESLVKQGAMKTAIKNLSVVAYSDDAGAVYCYLRGAKTFEQSLFINNLQEVIDIIDNPRYVIVRKNKIIVSFVKKDYHAVPEILGRNKINAEYFSQKWTELIGECELIYTRTIDGRKRLLEMRMKSLSSHFAEEWHPEQISKWR